MLKFVGTGSAFNTEFGNNSAYIKKGNKLLLIDCGSSTFSRIKNNGLLDGVENITVIITHLHPDHIGSIGDLIFYCHYGLRCNAVIYAPEVIVKDLRKILDLTGISGGMYGLFHMNVNKACTIGGLRVIPIKVEHVHNLNCFGYILNNEFTTVYYSGDSNMIPEHIINEFINVDGDIDYIYQDTCLEDYEGNVHLSLRKLEELIPPEYRHKVFCMHLDDIRLIDEANKLGFNCVIATVNSK